MLNRSVHHILFSVASLSSQLGVKKFSYYLASHRFDDTGKSSILVLDFNASGEKTADLSCTPLQKNPNPPLSTPYFFLTFTKLYHC